MHFGGHMCDTADCGVKSVCFKLRLGVLVSTGGAAASTQLPHTSTWQLIIGLGVHGNSWFEIQDRVTRAVDLRMVDVTDLSNCLSARADLRSLGDHF